LRHQFTILLQFQHAGLLRGHIIHQIKRQCTDCKSIQGLCRRKQSSIKNTIAHRASDCRSPIGNSSIFDIHHPGFWKGKVTDITGRDHKQEPFPIRPPVHQPCESTDVTREMAITDTNGEIHDKNVRRDWLIGANQPHQGRMHHINKKAVIRSLGTLFPIDQHRHTNQSRVSQWPAVCLKIST
tara:strand:+ start:105392 stop:105940 length:549 start_codon:yes stop_codon:yes gene_type:complete